MSAPDRHSRYQPDPLFVEIVGAAQTLWERIEVEPHARSVVDESIVQERLKSWREMLGDDGQNFLERRLEWDGLSLEKMSHSLGAGPAPLERLPAWAHDFKKWIWDVPGMSLVEVRSDPLFDADRQYPFEELLIPFVRHAIDEVCCRVPSAIQLLSEQAYKSLGRSLLWNLSKISAQCFSHELERFLISNSQTTLSRIISTASNADHSFQYDQFVAQQLASSERSILHRYPVLGRLMAVAIQSWLSTQIRFLNRLESDHQNIKAIYEVQGNGQVLDLEIGLSDQHYEADTVSIVRFSDGTRVVYKPKSLILEQVLDEVLSEAEKDLSRKQYSPLKRVIGEGYGWVEFLSPDFYKSEKERNQYYRNSGCLLAVIYALNGSDFHSENVIACRDHLVPIDAETLLLSEGIDDLETTPGLDAYYKAKKRIERSVLRSGLLPVWTMSAKGDIAFDMSALGDGQQRRIPGKASQWIGIGTDFIRMEQVEAELTEPSNIPDTSLEPNLAEHVDNLCSGFEHGYRRLMTDEIQSYLREKLAGLPADTDVRFILRPTQTYAWILYRGLAPRYLEDGIDWSIQLDVLARGFRAKQKKSIWWAALREERRALENGNIPAFMSRIGERSLHSYGREIPNTCFASSPLKTAFQRLDNLSEHDLAEQLELMRASLASTQKTQHASSHNSGMRRRRFSDKSSLSSDEMLQEAVQIGERVIEQSIDGDDGSAAWIDLSFSPLANQLFVSVAAESLYDGNAGIGLFLSELAAVTGEHRFRTAAGRAFRSLTWLSEDLSWANKLAVDQRLSVGGVVGLGSIVYALSEAAHLLRDKSLLEQAVAVSRLIDSQGIANDTQFDLLSGSAGAILSLCNLEWITGEAEFLSEAERCAARLKEHAQTYFRGGHSWSAGSLGCLCGASHGASGIALALMRLHERVGDSTLKILALEALRFEENHFSPEEQGWKDLRDSFDQQQVAVLPGWCNGRAGGVLNRLRIFAHLEEAAEYAAQLRSVLGEMLSAGLSGVDNLCCGDAGIAWVLLEAGRELNELHYEEKGKSIVGELVRGRRKRGFYTLIPGQKYSLNRPSLFQGESGIGMALLRASGLVTDRCVLALEPGRRVLGEKASDD